MIPETTPEAGAGPPRPSSVGPTPGRVQLRRSRGWRKPVGSVVVARPSRWGNPFTVADVGSREEAVHRYRDTLLSDPAMVAAARAMLSGRVLCCWCPLVDSNGIRVPCYADVLLEVANAGDGAAFSATGDH